MNKEYYEELERIAKDKYLSEQPETCSLCDSGPLEVEVTTDYSGTTIKTHICLECFNDLEYQQLIKENQSTIKLINPE